MQKLINKDMPIYQVVKTYPETIGAFKEMGLQCSSCVMSTFETLEEGALGHGWTRDDVAELVNKLNDVIANRVEFNSMR